MDHILDKIYVGGWDDADKIRDCNSWYIITVGHPHPNKVQVLGHADFLLTDPGKDLEDKSRFTKAVGLLLEDPGAGIINILVHCQVGVNRSVSVVMAYIMVKHKYTLEEAYRLMIKKRPQAWPLLGYAQMACELANQPVPTQEDYNKMRMKMASEYIFTAEERIESDLFYKDAYGLMKYELDKLVKENKDLEEKLDDKGD